MARFIYGAGTLYPVVVPPPPDDQRSMNYRWDSSVSRLTIEAEDPQGKNPIVAINAVFTADSPDTSQTPEALIASSNLVFRFPIPTGPTLTYSFDVVGLHPNTYFLTIINEY